LEENTKVARREKYNAFVAANPALKTEADLILDIVERVKEGKDLSSYPPAQRDKVQAIKEAIYRSDVIEARLRTKILYSMGKLFNQTHFKDQDLKPIVDVFATGTHDPGSVKTLIEQVMKNNHPKEREKALRTFNQRCPEQKKRAALFKEVAEAVRNKDTKKIKSLQAKDKNLIDAVMAAWEKKNPSDDNDPLQSHYQELAKSEGKSEDEVKKDIQARVLKEEGLDLLKYPNYPDLAQVIYREEMMSKRCTQILEEASKFSGKTIMGTYIKGHGNYLGRELASLLRSELNQDFFDLLAPGFEAGAEVMRFEKFPKTEQQSDEQDLSRVKHAEEEEKLYYEHFQQAFADQSRRGMVIFLNFLADKFVSAFETVFRVIMPKVLADVSVLCLTKIAKAHVEVAKVIFYPFWLIVEKFVLKDEVAIHTKNLMENSKNWEQRGYIDALVKESSQLIKV
jgi:hypothetical protein